MECKQLRIFYFVSMEVHPYPIPKYVYKTKRNHMKSNRSFIDIREILIVYKRC